ncbi:elongation of very long chain fatty acids protein 1-like [Apis cerana]|uniref:elongation of very long chain fatty acids protein 1-like n=1 Tax=Apis cerana TaxID=7461 RepID=UPI0007E2B5C5|nr:elongation of very long chain fatty acids protein 1-like [Apis cerana]
MKLIEIYNYYWNEKSDTRTNNLPLMGSPIIIPAIILSYLYFVLKYGPQFMKNRKPYNLKTFIQWYNIFQIIANAYLVQQNISAGWFSEISVYCELPDYSYKPGPMKIAYTMWLTTMLKLIDLVETVVFVLRKKQEQISFLHVYHHVSTILLIWFMTKYYAVSMTSFGILINCTVHVIMYTYYYLTTLGPNMQKMMSSYKPIITSVQMVQFVICTLYALQTYSPSCPVPKAPVNAAIFQMIMNFLLFFNFYRQNYIKSIQKKH